MKNKKMLLTIPLLAFALILSACTNEDKNPQVNKEGEKIITDSKNKKDEKNISRSNTDPSKSTNSESSNKENIKETRSESNQAITSKSSSNESPKEKVKETKREARSESNSTITSKSSSNKSPKEKVKETKRETTRSQKITYNTVTRQENFRDYDVIDRYKGKGSDSRVYQEGKKGYDIVTYKITYKDGVETNREVTKRESVNPKDEIIERYVKVSDEKWKDKEVDDLTKPVYNNKVIKRWFVREGSSDSDYKIHYFYDKAEAFEEYKRIPREKGVVSSWGTAENEVVDDYDDILGYRKKIESVKVADEVYEWKH